MHLIDQSEMTEKADSNEQCIWMLTQQLTQAIVKGGIKACTKILADIFGSNGERAKDLAYKKNKSRGNYTHECKPFA